MKTMDPSVCEFIAENEIIQILPNFNERTIHLISGDFGPFEAGSPVTVPLWFALQLKYKHKCKIVPPEWLKVDELKKLVVVETERTTFSPLPNCFFEIAHILVTNAYSDLENVEQLKMLVRDLQDKREAKMRTSIIKFMEQFQKEKDDIFSDKAVIHANAQLNNLSRLEICYFRAALTEPSKWLDKLFSVLQGGMKSQTIDD
uniref:DNA replication complex GINS protein PSF2 n=1 Tax=Meloidogyne incognita TaxID=6306 RepID=A0A914LAC3_MELIC